MTTTPVYLEVGQKKVFACAVDWPGWARAGRTDEDAIEALATYAERYAPVAAAAGVKFSLDHDFAVVERLPGTMTTDFGAPNGIPEIDRQPLTKPARTRIAALVGATWTIFDEIAATTPPELRKGPRGGGRDRNKMIDHVYGAEASYLRKLGIKHKQPAIGDTEAVAAIRAETLKRLADPPPETAWPMPYLARRVAWHVLDHAWEMQDKTL